MCVCVCVWTDKYWNYAHSCGNKISVIYSEYDFNEIIDLRSNFENPEWKVIGFVHMQA